MYPVRPAVLVLLTLASAVALANGDGSTFARIKDITQVEGVRANHLFGYGLVIGLSGTGDSNTGFSQQSISALMRNLGVPVDPTAIRTRSVAAVMVTAQLPPFARPGGTLDVTISTFGDCSSLQGGTLLPTELQGYDGRTHAVAQGPVTIGGVNPTGGGTGGVKRNHPTVARIPNGAIIEGEPVETDVLQKNVVRFLLVDPDFVTANHIKDTINRFLAAKSGNKPVATAINAGTVEVNVLPLVDQYDSLVALIAEIEALEVQTDEVARVVINERTGTVVMGHNVRISRAAVSHHDFSITFTRTEESLDDGRGRPVTDRVVTEETGVTEKKGPPFRVVNDAPTVRDLIDTLNDLGLKPRDMIAILQALHSAGALKAELVIL